MRYLYLSLLLCISSFSYAQTDTSLKVECATDLIWAREKQTNPTFEQHEHQLQLAISAKKTSKVNKKVATEIYQVPIVIHIVNPGNDPSFNFTDDDIKRKLKQTNALFRAQNVGLQFDSRYGYDTQIEFVLAVRDENGDCTSGINRIDYSTNTEYVNNGLRVTDPNGGILLKPFMDSLTWDTSKYYNIYIVNKFYNNGSAGFAYYPGAFLDGAVLKPNAFTSEPDTNLAHELGHALNLYHTFEGTDSKTCPSTLYTDGDKCADTPPYLGPSLEKDCAKSELINNCAIGYAPYGIELSTNKYYITNLMSYSYVACRTLFTTDQKDRMIATLEGQRSTLLTKNGNLSLTPPSAPSVDFTMENTTSCLGTELTLLDNSSCIPNTYLDDFTFNGTTALWTITNGTDVFTSTERNPKFSPKSTGLYNVTLTLTVDGLGTFTKTKENYITVGEQGTPSTCSFGTFDKVTFNYTVSKFEFNSISNDTGVRENDIKDFRCEKLTTVYSGDSYELAITANSAGTRTNYVKAWIDFNNDGAFDISEMVFADKLTATGSFTSGRLIKNIIIPTTDVVTNKILLMRVMSQVESSGTLDLSSDDAVPNDGCFTDNNTKRFDIEDYGVVVLDKSTLAINSIEKSTSWEVFKKGTTTTVKSDGFMIQNITVYDLVGRKIFDSKKINVNEYNINEFKRNQILIYKMTTNTGAVLTKKVMN
ncbi:M43 family zinc metalloprotease [Pseudotamlana haliotis]|nr:M43 family zinc metalloprotease [Tamlana haliotis]